MSALLMRNFTWSAGGRSRKNTDPLKGISLIKILSLPRQKPKYKVRHGHPHPGPTPQFLARRSDPAAHRRTARTCLFHLFPRGLLQTSQPFARFQTRTLGSIETLSISLKPHAFPLDRLSTQLFISLFVAPNQSTTVEGCSKEKVGSLGMYVQSLWWSLRAASTRSRNSSKIWVGGMSSRTLRQNASRSTETSFVAVLTPTTERGV